MDCVWIQTWGRSSVMRVFGGQIIHLQPPLDTQLSGRSTWLTMLQRLYSNGPCGWRRKPKAAANPGGEMELTVIPCVRAAGWRRC